MFVLFILLIFAALNFFSLQSLCLALMYMYSVWLSFHAVVCYVVSRPFVIPLHSFIIHTVFHLVYITHFIVHLWLGLGFF